MHLDVGTLSVVTVFVTALLAALLVFAGLQHPGADRVRRNFAEAAAGFAHGDLVPTVSVGVTLGIDAKSSIDTLLDVANRALYRAKANGRNRVEATAPIDEMEAPFASAPSIVPLIGPGRVALAGGGRRRTAH